ncbi:hypothetical protein [Paraburkholderia sp. J7]|uniref:hypothetical protein n=1 Tax=Paraburkholderia sp. J7 TaxID=2805438 RepID=UPI002AB64977|nr:hypothetical protein [Paraburkholderia sp. J7]
MRTRAAKWVSASTSFGVALRPVAPCSGWLTFAYAKTVDAQLERRVAPHQLFEHIKDGAFLEESVVLTESRLRERWFNHEAIDPGAGILTQKFRLVIRLRVTNDRCSAAHF